jgi:5-methylcytosine-specific restriction endonuclease McrA
MLLDGSLPGSSGDVMNKSQKYPHCSIFIDPLALVVSTGELSCTELGALIHKAFEEARRGNFGYLKSIPFVTGFHKGWIKRRPLPSHVKREVLSYGRCVVCATTERLTVDHKIPVIHGGGDEIENLQCLCSRCNREKGPEKNG